VLICCGELVYLFKYFLINTDIFTYNWVRRSDFVRDIEMLAVFEKKMNFKGDFKKKGDKKKKKKKKKKKRILEH